MQHFTIAHKGRLKRSVHDCAIILWLLFGCYLGQDHNWYDNITAAVQDNPHVQLFLDSSVGSFSPQYQGKISRPGLCIVWNKHTSKKVAKEVYSRDNENDWVCGISVCAACLDRSHDAEESDNRLGKRAEGNLRFNDWWTSDSPDVQTGSCWAAGRSSLRAGIEFL